MMIDCHCHILPGMDDGAKTLEESILMARQAVVDGIKTVVATPHGFQNIEEAEKMLEKRHVKIQELTKELQKQQIQLQVLPGMECVVCEATLEAIRKGLPIGLNNGRVILIEFINKIDSELLKKFIFQVQLLGKIVLIAHPERFPDFFNNWKLLKYLKEQNVYFQLTSGALLGDFGWLCQFRTWRLCKKNFVSILASDAHDSHYRPLKIKKSYEILRKIKGEDWMQGMLESQLLQEILT